MKRLLVLLISSGIMFPLVLMVAGIITIDTRANPLKQDSCEAACACQNHDISRLNQEYSDLSKAPYCCDDNGRFYSYPSLCAEQWYYWQKSYGGPVSDAQMNALYESFLSEKQSECDACQGSSNVVEETPEPSILLQPVEPVQNPQATATPTPSPTPEVPFPVVSIEMEKALDGSPYKGVTADGTSTLDITITNLDAERSVDVVVTEFIGAQRASEGQLTGAFVTYNGTLLGRKGLVVPPTTRVTIRYRPPESDPLGIYTSGGMINIQAEGGDRNLPATQAAMQFTINCKTCSDSQTIQLDYLILRPPILMVHGYLGNENTWNYLSSFLAGKGFDRVQGAYDPSTWESSIQTMAKVLSDDIDKLLGSYLANGIKTNRVDLVTHSMGGLISRQYLDDHPEDKVRKLVMLAAPHHGVDDGQRVTRYLASTASLGKHLIAGNQLNADNAFFNDLNSGEPQMLHLDLHVEYANIIGRASCGAKCPHDAVVDIASAHLNGVQEFIFGQTIHSAALISLPRTLTESKLGLNDTSITDSLPVAEKVLELLKNPITRSAPDPQWSLVLQNGQGKVYISPKQSEQQEQVSGYPINLPLNYRVRTGFDGLATIIFYLNGEEQKRVELYSSSDIVFGLASPDTLTAIMESGGGRFVTEVSPSGEVEDCDFNATVFFAGDPPIPHPIVQIRDNGTDFVVRAGEPITVTVLEGAVVMDTFDSDGKPVLVGHLLEENAAAGVQIRMDGTSAGVIIADAWWKNEFFNRSYEPPDWVAAQKREAAGDRVGEKFNPGGFTDGGLILLVASLCLGGLILAVFTAIVIVRRGRTPAAVPASRQGLMGISGWLLAAVIAGLAVACLGSAAGVLWWQGVFDLPSGKTVMDKSGGEEEKQILISQLPIAPPPPPVPVSMQSAKDQASAGQPVENNLSETGLWIVYTAEDGLWAANEDGSSLTHLIGDPFLGPADLHAAISPDGGRVAFITASDPDSPRDPVIFIVSLPDVTLHGILDLTIPEKVPMPDAAVCDPGLEAARAATIGNGLAWSPDGSKLAFSAALEGSTADVYLYSFDEDSIQRLTDEPGQAYDLHWSAEENKIVYFSANCFGTGGGFDMEGVYAVDPDTGGQTLLYRPDEQSYGEKFVDWLFTDRTKFIAATVSGCPFRDMRLVDINTGEVSPIYDGCFEDYAVGPTSMLAVLTSRDMSDKPGVYLFPEPEYGFEPIHFPNENGRRIFFEPGLMEFLIQNHEKGYKEILSVDLNGEQGWFIQRGEFPAFSKDGEYWVWEDQSEFYLGGVDMETPLSLIKQPVLYPIWSEILMDELYRQQVLFSRSKPPYALYRLVPGRTLETVGEGMKPIAPPVIVYP